MSQSISAVSQSTSDVAVQQATAGTAILRMLDTTNNVRSHCMPKQLLHAALLLYKHRALTVHSKHTRALSAGFRFVQNYDETNTKTHQGMNLRRLSMTDVYKQFGLGEMTIDFIGHAIALHRDDSYMGQPAYDTVMKVKLYYNSLTRFEGTASPYIYPLYGLGELPQVQALKC